MKTNKLRTFSEIPPKPKCEGGMKTRPFFRYLLVVSIVLVLVGATPSISPSTNVFKTGESIRFGAYSNGIKVGFGSLVYRGQEVLRSEQTQHVEFQVSSFTVNDKEDVYGAVDFSSPILVNRNVSLFGRNEIISEDYAADRKSVKILKKVNNAPVVTQDIASRVELNNVLLFIYKLRNDPELKVGKSYRIALPTQVFELIVRAQRNLRVPLGVFKTFYIESDPPKYKIWLKTDKDRAPIRIQGFIGAGLVYLSAIEISNP